MREGRDLLNSMFASLGIGKQKAWGGGERKLVCEGGRVGSKQRKIGERGHKRPARYPLGGWGLVGGVGVGGFVLGGLGGGGGGGWGGVLCRTGTKKGN